jgi:hypothetical protein
VHHDVRLYSQCAPTANSCRSHSRMITSAVALLTMPMLHSWPSTSLTLCCMAQRMRRVGHTVPPLLFLSTHLRLVLYTLYTRCGVLTGSLFSRLHLSSEFLSLLKLPLGCQAGAFVGHRVASAAAVADGTAAVGARLATQAQYRALQRLEVQYQIRLGMLHHQQQPQQLLGSCGACCDPVAAGCTCHHCCPAAEHNLV